MKLYAFNSMHYLMRNTLLVILLCFAGFLFSQTTPATKKKWHQKSFDELVNPDSLVEPHVCIKVAPISLLGIYTGPSVRGGIDFKIKDNWAIYHEYGYFLGNRGFITKLEFKCYLSDEPKHSFGNYVSVELSYKYQNYNTSDSITKVDSGNNFITTYDKAYTVTKHVECLTIKFGNMHVYRAGIVLDAFIGAGIRVKQAQNTLTGEENEHIQHSSDYGPNVFTNEAGFKVYPNIDMGVKIGYRIK